MLFRSPRSTTGGAYPTANVAQFYPIIVRAPFTARSFTWRNGAAVSGNVDMGIYTSTGTRLVSTGSTAQSGTSVLQTATCTATLIQPGDYYLGFACDNTTSTFGRVAIGAIPTRSQGIVQMAAAFPLPASATFAVSALNYILDCCVATTTTI